MNNIEIAYCKAKIIIYGIDFDRTKFENCASFKMKRKNSKPVINNKEVFDESNKTEMIPSEIIIEVEGKRSLVKTRHNALSPVKARKNGKHLIILFEEDHFECIGELVDKYQVLDKKFLVKNKEYKVKDFLSIVGMDRISILLYDGCSNWNIGIPCKFCDMHPKPRGEKVYIPTINELYRDNLDIDIWWGMNKQVYIKGVYEAYKTVVNDNTVGPHFHNFIMAGSLPNAFYPWKFVIELLSKIKNEIVGELIVNLQPHPDKKTLARLRKLGVTQIQYNIEVFGREMYASICPDKISYDLLIEKMKEAVEIFGSGNVRSNFVLGLQPLKEVYEGIDMLANLGVVPDYSIFQPKKNTAFENHKTADLRDVVECSKYLCKIYKKYDYKPIFCNLSSRSSIMNEMYEFYEENNKFE